MTDDNIPLTIFTPVRNAEAYFARTLDSISAQTCKAFEYIVLDAASTDSTPAIIEQYRAVISYTHSKPDKGAVDAFNTGIAMARGDYIAFLSADDWIEPYTVEYIVNAAKANPEADIISFGMTEWQEDAVGNLTHLATYYDPDDGLFDVPNALYSPCISRCFRRALYLQHGLYRHADFGHFSDRELQLRFALHKPKKVVIPKVLYHFRKHEASATGNAGVETTVKSMECNMRIAEEYLAAKQIDPYERRELLQWYGFAWIRAVFFSIRAKQASHAAKTLLEGFLKHPLACIISLFSAEIPSAYRGRPEKL